MNVFPLLSPPAALRSAFPGLLMLMLTACSMGAGSSATDAPPEGSIAGQCVPCVALEPVVPSRRDTPETVSAIWANAAAIRAVCPPLGG